MRLNLHLHGRSHLPEGSDPIRALGDATLNVIIDGNGAALTTGIKGDILLERSYVIQAATVLADTAGDIVLDIWTDAYGSYPPTVLDTITAAAKPTLSGVASSRDTTLTGWTTSITGGDTLRFNVDSVATVTRVCLALRLRPV